ncbi:MAG TPA: hypothetical protein VFI15_02305 [Candidatus Limnocylindrales bacterium]|nr:hypothetical protein [Candidatus Limnocylindrales bacterium]
MTRLARGAGVIALVIVGIVVLSIVAAVGSCGCSQLAPSGAAVQSPVDGIVVSVDAASLTDVRAFTLRTSSGQSLAFTLGALENATQFSPSHLKEHQATSVPIRVWFQVVNGERIAYRLEDAPAG